MTVAGWKSKAGLAEESSWAVPAAVAYQVPFLSEELEETYNLKPIPGEDGLGAYRFDKYTGIRYSGPIRFSLPYLGAYSLIGSFFKLALGRSSEAAGDCSYWPDKTQPGSDTFCVLKGETVNEYSGLKILGLAISGSGPNEPVLIECDAVAKLLDTESTTNASASAWALIDALPARFGELTLRANDAAGAALSSADDLKIIDFTVQVEGDYIIHQSPASGLYIDEPKRKKWGVVGTFTLASAEAASAWRTRLQGATAVKLCFDFSATDASYTYHAYLWFPAARVTLLGDPLADEALTNPVVRFQAFKPDAAPTGFPSTLSEVIVQLTRTAL